MSPVDQAAAKGARRESVVHARQALAPETRILQILAHRALWARTPGLFEPDHGGCDHANRVCHAPF